MRNDESGEMIYIKVAKRYPIDAGIWRDAIILIVSPHREGL